MSARGAARLAWGLTLLALSLAVAAFVFVLLARSGGGPSVVSELLFLALPVSFSAVGGLLARRRPENRVGWLCLVIGLLWALQETGWWVATWAGNGGMLGAAAWAGVLGSLWLPAVGLTGMHLALRLPGGSLLSPRWRWYSRFCTALIVLTTVLVATEPGRVAEVPGTENPLAAESLQTLSPLLVLFPLTVLGAIASLVLRYRRAGGVERLQIRWIAFGGVLLLAVVVVAFVPVAVGLVPEDSGPDWVAYLFAVAYTAIPVAIGISVLRYRLYSIDVVVNRTLVYGALTATLAAAYLVSVLLLQLLLRPLTEESDLAIAGSTLAVAALFRPARSRIQALVDRRFYRRKYDATQTLASFSARLREEVDLDALSAELRGVVSETMQPAHVSLWLRDAEAPR